MTKDEALAAIGALDRDDHLGLADIWWRTTWAKGPLDRQEMLAELGCRRGVEEIFGPSGLGVILRTSAIIALLRGTGEGLEVEPHAQFRARLMEEDRNGAFPKDAKTIREMLSPWSGLQSLLPRAWNPGVGDLFGRMLDDKYGPPKSGGRRGPELFTREFVGPDALHDFMDWIRGARVAGDIFVPNLKAAEFVLSDERITALGKLETAVFGHDETSSIVVNVHQRSMAAGLTASAGFLIGLRETTKLSGAGATKATSRRVLYLGLAGIGGTPTPTLPTIVACLRAFYLGEEIDPRAITPATDTQRALVTIRQGMATRPGIVILDGYSDSAVPEFAELHRRIQDDFIISLLKRLSDPPVGPLEHFGSLAEFRQNRIVVFSNRPLRHLLAGTEVEIEMPPPRDLPRVLQLQGFGDKKLVVMDIVRRIEVLRSSRSEALGYVLEATLLAAEKNFAEPHDVSERIRRRLTQKLNSVASPATGSAALDASIEVFLDELAAANPDLLWILMMIAISPDGLSAATIRRLLRAAARCTDDAGLPAGLLASDDPKLVDDLTGVCGDYLLARRMNDFEGAKPVYGGEFVGQPPLPADARDVAAMIDIGIEELRTALLGRVDASNFARVQAWHRLLAEEAIAQQTIAFRHEADVSSPRSVRKLLAALFHGLLSLPITARGEISERPLIKSGDFAIPRDPRQVWEWLQFFAYRQLLENGQNWNLSRLYGLDELKLDLLKLAARPWRGWARYPNLPKPRDFDSLVPTAPLHARTRELALDYHLSFAQAAAALGDRTGADGALLIAVGLGHNSARATLRLAKRQLDIALLRDDRADAEKIEEGVFDLLASARGELDEAVRTSSIALQNLVSPANYEAVRLAKASAFIGALRTQASKQEWGDNEIAQIADVLFRVGERWALIADEAASSGRDQELKTGDKGPPEATTTAVEKFSTSLAYFRIAEQVRLDVFFADPLGRHFIASGHSARQMVRVSLKLEGFARRAAGNPSPNPGYFATRARRMADVLARHLWRHPRERVSMLILEATMARLLPQQRDPSLAQARRLLRDAEPVMSSLSFRNRVWMRFLLERIKVHRHMAENSSGGARDALIEYCRLDLDHLSRLVEDHDLKLWKNLHSIQHQRVERLRSAKG